jgi:hypothetical protein
MVSEALTGDFKVRLARTIKMEQINRIEGTSKNQAFQKEFNSIKKPPWRRRVVHRCVVIPFVGPGAMRVCGHAAAA